MKKKKWLIDVFRRRVIVAVLIILQAAFLAYVIVSSSRVSQIISTALKILSLLVALHIISRGSRGSYKLLWLSLTLAFPIFGGLLYLMLNFQSSVRLLKKKSERSRKKTASLFELADSPLSEAQEALPQYSRQIGYLQNTAGFPVYDATESEYFSPGEEFLPKLLSELEKAERYIFLEFFIIERGKMFDPILEILKRKVKEGVDVRVLYDDIGCFLTLPKDFTAELKKHGIKAAIFNPFKPILTAVQNNRDHRKIASIDGKVAFTGGINLADEYINAYPKHGYWKDSAIMVSGKAAWSLTLIFLQNWQLVTGCDEDAELLYPWREEHCPTASDGYVQPYADSPLDDEPVSEQVYVQMISDAKRYLYIMTPYLIIDENMVEDLILAAKSGVDVRIITPHIWDKKLVHITTRSYYGQLIKGGVKIYEFTPGFIHSKVMVCDDEVATVGTVNLDYRSLYLHFECGVRLYNSSTVEKIREDYLSTLSKCQPICEEDTKKNFFGKLLGELLRLFAPLM